MDGRDKRKFLIMSKIYIGIDNGVTGSITIIKSKEIIHACMPVRKEQSYTKKKQNISRIDVIKLKELFWGSCRIPNSNRERFCLLERPMINPGRWKASMSAIRALEATLIVLEELNIPYQYCDSKEWQKMFLPNEIKGSMDLKRVAIDVTRRLFPQIKTKDADSILIAEYARRKGF